MSSQSLLLIVSCRFFHKDKTKKHFTFESLSYRCIQEFPILLFVQNILTIYFSIYFVPQFITLAFDDAVTISNIETYRQLLYDRRNPNGCTIGTTFFVSHEYTNYQFVNELYNRGFEIALHSISHRADQTYWSRASYEDIVREIGEQKEQMAHFGNIPTSEIKGKWNYFNIIRRKLTK